MRLTDMIVRVLLIFVFAYLAAIGATWNGVINPDFRMATVGLMAVAVIGWLVIHWRRRWQWYRTPFDLLLVAWGVVFVISLLANSESWRRSVIGLWYMLVYIGVWYVLSDAISNRKLDRAMLVDALLITGLVIMGLGYWQVWNLVQNDGYSFFSTRPVSVIGNTNALAAFLLVVLPFSLARTFNAKLLLGRMVMGVYSLLLLLMIFLTFSRGGWLGTGAALVIYAILALYQQGLLSIKGLRQWFASQSETTRHLLAFFGLLAVIAVVIISVLLMSSFSMGGRSADRRLPLWESALAQFAEKPFTGQGFFTFGCDLALTWPMPPENMHSHAHSIPLDILAELGLPGLIIFLFMSVVIYRVIRRNLHAASERDKPLYIAAAAALVGFGIQHLFDIPAMMPLIALTGLLALIIGAVPLEPQPHTSQTGKVVFLPLMLILWAVIIGTGVWSNGIYSQYIAALQYAVESADYAGAAEQMHSLTESDPTMPVYHLQEAFMWGMAAAEGNLDAAQNAVDTYDRFLVLEPYHAVSWANKAALHWQLGQIDEAVASIQQAAVLSPDYTLFHVNQDIYRGVLSPRPFVMGNLNISDFKWGPNYILFQFLHDTYPRQFLPQVGQ